MTMTGVAEKVDDRIEVKNDIFGDVTAVSPMTLIPVEATRMQEEKEAPKKELGVEAKMYEDRIRYVIAFDYQYDRADIIEDIFQRARARMPDKG